MLVVDSCSFYCPQGTVNPIPCGNSTVYCPAGVASPAAVTVGFYASGSANLSTASSQTQCVAGQYCVAGVASSCPIGRFGSTPGLSSASCSGDCAQGRFGDVPGLTNSTCAGECPPGRFGATTALTSWLCSGTCVAGTFGNVSGLTLSTCSGNCSAGSVYMDAHTHTHAQAC